MSLIKEKNTNIKLIPTRNTFSFDIAIKKLNISDEEKQYPIVIAARSTEFQTENFIPMKWNKKDKVLINKISDPVNLTLPLSENEIAPDAHIYLEMFTNTKNSAGLPSPNRAGEIFFSYRDLKDIAKSKEEGKKNITANINYHQAETAGKTENKGEILITLQDYDALSKIKFEKVKPFHFVKENYKIIEEALNRRAKIDETFLKKYPPSVKELKNVAIPFQISMIAPIPAESFWVDNRKTIPYEEREEVAYRKVKAVLNRHDMTEEHFNSIIETQFKSSKLHPEMREVCKILANVCTLNANNWYYKADEGYIQNQKVGVEDFLHINRLASINASVASGDCEDTQEAAFDTFRSIQEDIYKTDTMKNLQKVSKEFIVIGSLASVEGQKVEDADGKRKDVFVGDNTNIKTGAHMFSMAIPLREFEKLAKTGSETLKYRHTSKLHPNVHLFKLVLEGTGAISPLIFPETAYSTTKEEFEKEKIKHENLLSVINTFEKKTIGISYGSRPRIPSRSVDKNNLMPQFYRYIRKCFVGDALGNKNGDTFFACTDENESGVSIRSMVLSDNLHVDISKEHFTPFKFVMVPRPNEFDAKIFERLKKQLPLDPGEVPVKVNISANISSPGGVSIYSTLNNFNTKCEKITQSRRKNKNETMNYTVSYKNTEVFDMMHKDKKLIEIIGQEVLDNDFIVGARANFNQISNISSFVDVKFAIDLDKLKKDKDSLIKGALISNRARFREEYQDDDDDVFFEEDNDEDNEYDPRYSRFSKEKFGSSFIQMDDNKKKIECGIEHKYRHPHSILYRLIKELEAEQLHAKISNPIAFLTPGYGYSFFLYILRMEHVKKMLNSFLSNTHDKGVFVPFLDEDALMELKQDYDLYNHSLHEKVIKDHFFIIENDKIITLGEYMYSKKTLSLSMFDDTLRVKSKSGENEYEIFRKLKIDELDAYLIDGVIDL